ncbi:MAG: glycosyltransferase family 4 protein, partial [Planctomycetota bacterium]|nr:glycosyltransferase family 4 protein [Planctomycetota bacterium]
GVNPARDLFARRKLKSHLAAFAPDVLHTHASKAGTLGRQALRSLRARERIARVHTFHGHVLEGYFPEMLSKRIAAHEARLANETDRIVAASHATGDDLLRLGVVSEDKLVVVPPGIELDELLALAGERSGAVRGPIGAAPGDFVVGVVGRLAEVKRLDLALEVFELMRARHPGLHLVFVGDGGERRRLERRIRQLGHEGGRSTRERVHMVGTMERMADVLADLDCVLLTSRAEGLPVALIEAAAAAVPVVAADVGGVSEVVVHERTGFLGETVEELAFGLDQLIADRELGAVMGRRARLRAAERHSAERLAERLEELYRVVCEERGCGS